MEKVNFKKVNQITGDYEVWLQKRLKNKKYAYAYLQVALDNYKIDHDKEALMLALKDMENARS